MRPTAALAIAALALPLAGAAAPQARPAYAEGQVWEYRTRPQDAGLVLRIQKIEQLAAFASQGPVYHISIVGVHYADTHLTGDLRHAPVSRQTLDASVTRLSGVRGPFPDPSAGIAQWREARGGVFTIPVADIVGLVEQTATRSGGLPGAQRPGGGVGDGTL